MNIFIFHRDLRLDDNTTLIKQLRDVKEVVPIFIFSPDQVDKTKNKYMSNNFVQFMCESIRELDREIVSYNGALYCFYGDNIKVLESLSKISDIQSIGFNIDYSPFALARDKEIIKYAKKNDIRIYCAEDSLLYNILDGGTAKSDGTPYTVFTPFMNNCLNNLKYRTVDKMRTFRFKKLSEIKKSKYYFADYDRLYKENRDIHVRGGRENGLKILRNMKKFKDYNKKRDFLEYETTSLSAYINLGLVSIREVRERIKDVLGSRNNLIKELHWRDFYYNVLYYFPHVIRGAFKEQYNKLWWSSSEKNFRAWCEGKTGFPIVDACMRQLNKTGFMHNRGRMIVSSFLTKDLHIDWRKGERYFATQLVDYNISANNGGWQWSAGTGTDAQPYFRVFNPWSQSEKYDAECKYIKKWVPELRDVENKHVHRWNEYFDIEDYGDIKYPEPMVDHDKERTETLRIYRKV